MTASASLSTFLKGTFFVTTNLTLAFLFVLLLLYLRQPRYSPTSTRSKMIPKKVYDLCRSDVSVSSEYAQDPSLHPSKIIKKLFGAHPKEHIEGEHLKDPKSNAEDLQRAFECGKWGNTRPSDLFLRVSSCLSYALSNSLSSER